MSKGKGTKDKNEISRELIFETIVSEAAGLYNLLITVSTGVFGATLLFLDRIAPSPTKASLLCLALGWLMLILCTVACVWIRWKNLESGRMVLEGKFKEASDIDKPNRRLTKFAIFGLFCGIVLVAIFGFINIVHKGDINERNCKMCQNKEKPEKVQSKKDITERAIPYGSIETPEDEQKVGTSDESQGDSGQSNKNTETK